MELGAVVKQEYECFNTSKTKNNMQSGKHRNIKKHTTNKDYKRYIETQTP